jgi:AAA domain
MSIRVLPDEIAELIDDASPAEDAASDAVVAAFIAGHQTASRPDVLNGLRAALAARIKAGESVHMSAISVVTGAMKEARAGYYTPQHALDTLKPVFINAVALGGSTGKVRTGAVAESEWDGIVAWAVAQTLAADPDEVRARTEQKMPNSVEWVDRIGAAGAAAVEDQPQTDAEVIEGMPRLWPATDLKAAAQPSWLAKNRIQRAAINLLIGDEGIGKSLLWVWIIAYVTTGKALPEFGIPARDPAHVILVCTEDDWQTTVLPRLEVAGADLAMIQVICTDDDGSGAPTFPRDLFLIAEADPAPAVVVVDAWLDTVPPGLSVKDPQQARRALHPWKELATTTGAAMLLICHTNRVASANARDRYGATIELRKKARVTLFAQQDDEGRLVVGPEKMNTAAAVSASQFTIEAVQHFPPTTDHDGTVPRLTHVGESTLTAREHLAEIYAANHDTTARDDAVAWLASYLADGPRWAKDAHSDGERAGYSEKKRYTAKKRLGVEATRADGDGPWFWRLPQHTDRQPGHPDGQMPPVSAIWPSGPSGGHLENPHNLSTSQDRQMADRETYPAVGEGPNGEPLCRCGTQLTSPTSIWRGYCERCRLDSKDCVGTHIPGNGGDRRPGCIACAGQPQPCHFCQLWANKRRDGAA